VFCPWGNRSSEKLDKQSFHFRNRITEVAEPRSVNPDSPYVAILVRRAQEFSTSSGASA